MSNMQKSQSNHFAAPPSKEPEREPSCTETTTHPPTVATARRHGKRWTKTPFNVDDDNADCQEVETATP
jgi:hypothetical protein